MKIDEFVIGYMEADDKEKYIRENVEFTHYAPFNTKVAYAESIVANASTYKDGLVNRDSVRRRLMTNWSLLRIYTNLQLEPEKVIENYDALGSCGALDAILEIILNETDGDCFRVYVEDKEKDRDYNTSEIHNFITKCVVSLSPMITPLLSTIADTLNNVDTNKINELIADKIGDTDEHTNAIKIGSN